MFDRGLLTGEVELRGKVRGSEITAGQGDYLGSKQDRLHVVGRATGVVAACCDDGWSTMVVVSGQGMLLHFFSILLFVF